MTARGPPLGADWLPLPLALGRGSRPLAPRLALGLWGGPGGEGAGGGRPGGPTGREGVGGAGGAGMARGPLPHGVGRGKRVTNSLRGN